MSTNVESQASYSILKDLGIELQIDPYDLDKLQKRPASILVCNHLYPGIDEVLLSELANRTNEKLVCLHPNKNYFPVNFQAFHVSPRKPKNKLYGGKFSSEIEHLIGQGIKIGISLPFSKFGFTQIGNPNHTKDAIDLIQKLNQDMIPVHFICETPILWHKIISRAKKIVSQKPAPIKIRAFVGNRIEAKDLKVFDKNRKVRQYVQACIFSLGTYLTVKKDWFIVKPQKPSDLPKPLAAEIEPERIIAEIDALRDTHRILSRSQFEVFVAHSSFIPYTILEIGRLREITYRAVGEGSGHDRDLDQYDLYYDQLIIWDNEAKRLVGGYRLCSGQKVIYKYGFHGFYSHSLFKFKKEFQGILEQSLELGRSYIVPDYQKKLLPLFLQWQCILEYMKRDKSIAYIIGPVSITNGYAKLSKELMVSFLAKYYTNDAFKGLVEPRLPFQIDPSKKLAGTLSIGTNGCLNKLSAMVESIEPTHDGIPVLIKQYIRQNARFLAFNRDPKFSNCIDGFMLLDVKELPQDTLNMLGAQSPKETPQH
jgi:hypothetical protein